MRRSEDLKGWIGSLLFHLLAGVALFLWQVGMTSNKPDFLEVRLGSLTMPQTALPGAASPSASGSSAPIAEGRSSLNLPERRFLRPDDDVLRLPAAKKLDVTDAPLQRRVPGRESTVAQKDRGIGKGAGTVERQALPGRSGIAGAVPDPRVAGGGGIPVGTGVSVSMVWSDGGTRKKISGDLPEYPPGVQVEAQIRIEATVMPDGTVRNLKPAQKGNTKLEDAAMKAVRLWRFDPLRRSLPQREQECVITFNFQLR